MRSASRVLAFALVLLAGIGSLAWGQTRIPLTAETTHLTLLEQQENSLVYRAEISELVAMQVDTPEGRFARLLIPGFHFSHAEGAPELPMMNRLVALPYGATARIEVLSASSREIDLGAYGITTPLFPSQPSMPKNVDPADWPFVYDRAAYAAPRVAQELARVEAIGRLRAADMGRVELSPVEYFPGQHRIVVHDRVDFRVVFEGGDKAQGDELYARTYSPFFQPVYDRLDGFRGIHSQYPDRVRDVVTLVIVTPPEFVSTLQPFVDWKIQRGFHTIVGEIGTPEVGVTKESIQAWIRNLYENGTPQQPAPSFVVFAGDIAQVPTFTASGDPTDRPYCTIDADLEPDIYYGRLSATNPTQLQAILNKTIRYDQAAMADLSYLGEVVMIAGMDGNFGPVWANGQINYGTTNYFNEAHGILSHTYLYPVSGNSEAQIIQNINDGIGYINYTAHGSETSWSDPTMTQSDVNNLTNYDKFCFAVGNCCLTSSYDVPECFGETWLRVVNKGAIGYIGGSNSTYWDEDYYWGVGYRTSIVVNPTYDGNHLGAYDGVFHDHGEAMEQWYVTSDAMIFCGNLAVTESGSPRITYYWNIYNLLGDPSLSTYLGVPSANPVVHPPTIFTNMVSIPVQAVPGSYVGLTRDGEVLGAGTVGPTGTLDLPIWEQPLSPGPAHLVVTMQNRLPYQADVNIIVPATVVIDPMVIDANVTTAVTVGVFEADGYTPKPGIDVWAAGLDYESTHQVTDATGHCVLSVTYPFGPTIDIVGKDPQDPWELFRIPIEVRALALNHPDLWVTTTIGLADTFALNLPGQLHAQVAEPGAVLWAHQDGAPLGHVAGNILPLTPSSLSTITGTIAVSGYDLYSEPFPVIEAYGTLTGHIDAAGGPAANAILRGYDGDGAVAFEAVTNAQGNFDVGDEILVAPYTITVDHFGSLHWEQEYFLNYGANFLDIDLEAAPSGVLTGFVREDETDEPLEATIRIFRVDNGELYAETMSNPVDGSYTTPALPYFDYTVKVRAWHHIPVTEVVTVDQPSIVRNYWLDPTLGEILLIDDSQGKAGVAVEAKVDPKTGAVLSDGFVPAPGKAAADIIADLEELGYTVTSETIPTTDPATWFDYDLLIVSAGSNADPLSESAFRTQLVAFVDAGGHLLLEGGEVGYDCRSDTNFASRVMHITAWNHDQSGNVTIATPAHYVVSVPNAIAGPITMSYATYGDQDALTVKSDAVKVGAWSSYPSDGSIIAYDPNPAPEGGQIVFYSFNYSAMDAVVRPNLLENTVLWLMTPEYGNCSVAGTALLAGQQDHSGIKVEAIPNGGFVYTNAQGQYLLPNLFAGSYTIRASKSNWSTEAEEVTLTSGQNLTGIDFLLTPVQLDEICRQPHTPIPDNNPTGISDNMPVAVGGNVTGIRVYVNITHTYIGDLIVKLRSPAGTVAVLHNRTGSSADNIVGWYPTTLTPAESLDRFLGEACDGTWTLIVSDNASQDTGTLNEWCLELTHGTPMGVEDAETPKSLQLGACHPNPLHQGATILFDLPQNAQVRLGVYDVAGRKIAQLVSGTLAAGRHQVLWNGRDEAGRMAASGVYLYRLEALGQTLTRKMLVVR
ncbi:MAG: C25 family cysteine peptidase [Candidatus Eisenbacteria bacterium]